MGSPRKRKEKREKKKHKRDRSRSREREGHHRSRKSSLKDRGRRSRDLSSRGYDEEVSSERIRYDDVRSDKGDAESPTQYDESKMQELMDEKAAYSSAVQPVPPSEVEKAGDTEDFDIDELLDFKLSENPEFSERKQAARKFSAEDVSRNIELVTGRKRSLGDNEGSFCNIPGLDLANSSAESDWKNEGDASWDSVRNKADFEEQEVVVKHELEEEETVYQRISEPKYQDDGDSDLENSGQAQLSLSVAETNKLRAKLGLKPLEVSEQIPGLGGDSEEQATEAVKEVFVKTENIAEVKRAERLKEKIQMHKEKRKIAEKLSDVKPLGASDSDDDDSAAWVKKSRKLQEEREQAERRAKLLEEMDAEFGVAALVEEEFESKKKVYSSRDLRGLVVAHDSEMLKEGQHVILTLKDKGVLEEDDDVLQNVNLVDEERYARNVENKKKKPGYQPYEEEYDEFGILKKKELLSKYDEEIEGIKKKSFAIGVAGSSSKDREIEIIRMKLRQQQGVTLDMPNIRLASEYYTADDMVQFKKPKKRKKLRKTTVLKPDDLISDTTDYNETDFGSRKSIRKSEESECSTSEAVNEQMDDDVEMKDADDNENFQVGEDFTGVVIDEDQAEKELHSALNKARKLKQRKSVSAPEKVVVDVLKKTESADTDMEASKTGPIVLNSTAEFCRTLGDIPTYGMSGNRDEEADELMDFERELMEERQRQEMEAQNRGAWSEVNIDEEPTEIMIRENEPILEEEPDISLGVAGALQLAQKKGYLDKDTNKQLSGPRASHLQAQSYTIEEKFYEDDRFGKRDRYTGPIQDFREKSSYKPDVKLEYIDDSGRLLNAKEAFRYLSHKFHGKGPGKNKVDKRMKKLDQDTKLKQMSSTDTPLNTVKLLQAKQKEAQSPYIVLSGGSKALTQTMISKTKHT